MIIFRFIVLLFSLQSFVLDKDEIKAKLNEIIPDEILVDTVEDTYSPNFFSVELSDGSLSVSYTHLTLPTTTIV